MSRPTRSLRPSLDPLEAKTLLSSGAVGHAAGHPAARIARPELAQFYYINVQTSGFMATNVTWVLTVSGAFVQSGTVGNLGGPPPVRVYTTKAAANTLPSLFTFTYNVGDSKTPSYTDTGAGTRWTGSGTPPNFQTVTLFNPTGAPGGSNPTPNHHHQHHHHHEHHHHHHQHHHHDQHHH